MRQKPAVVAQKLLNLYRQSHVIFGGWGAINPILLAEATPEVISELANLPTGKNLIQHIENLRAGKTPADSIDPGLMPYGGMMTQSLESVHLSDAEIDALREIMNTFTPDMDGLNRIAGAPIIRRFGDDWLVGIRAALIGHSDLLDKWDVIIKTARAYQLWQSATDTITSTITDRVRAQIQADMPEYETYLPMFGDAGTELLTRLRDYVSSI